MGYFFCTYLPGYADFELEGKIIWHILLLQKGNSEKPLLLCMKFLIFPIPSYMCVYTCISCVYIYLQDASAYI